MKSHAESLLREGSVRAGDQARRATVTDLPRYRMIHRDRLRKKAEALRDRLRKKAEALRRLPLPLPLPLPPHDAA